MNMQYGFEDYQGNIWHDSLVDNYNRANEQVEKRERQNIVVNSLTWQELEYYKDRRHLVFQICVDIMAEENGKTRIFTKESSIGAKEDLLLGL